jgi:hypothetical protein
MTEAADLICTNGEVHALTDPDRTAEAVAVRDGLIVRVGDADEVSFLRGVETRTVDLGGGVLLPGFVDAHTHLPMVGRRLVHADLSGATGPEECVERMRGRGEESTGTADEWIQGFGYDESEWDESRYLRRGDLDAVSEARPVVAFREDMHVASLNSAALDRLRGELPRGDVRREGGDPTGVVVESAVGVAFEAVDPGVEGTRTLVEAAQAHANERGITGVHDMVRGSRAPRVYRDLEREGALTLRARLNYWSDHFDALVEAGLRTNHGSDLVHVGAIKTFSDGSIGGRTARLSEPYDDWPGAEDDTPDRGERGQAAGEAEGEEGDPRGEWVVPPAELRDLVARADREGFQVAIHAIGDEAVDEAIDALAASDAPGRARHRLEHVELADDDAIERIADLGVVASMQPNFHRWARPGGLYDSRLGDRRTETNRLRAFADAGAHLAFGSDCMPLDPLLGVHHAVNAPTEGQRLGVTEALRAYTRGAACAGFDEDRLGTIEVGKRADLVALDRSPWESPDEIRAIDVSLTVVDADVVYDGR